MALKKLITLENLQRFYTKLQVLLNAKQDAISDLTTIRSGAAAGATAVQPDDLVNVVDSGAKNRLDISSFTTKQSGGIKSVKLSDDTISVSRVGTSSMTSSTLVSTIKFSEARSYTLSGCPVGGSSSTYELQLRIQGILSAVATDRGQGASFTPNTTDIYEVRIQIGSNYSPDNLVFSPMITSTDEYNISPTFVPYGKTNAVLTSDMNDQRDALAETIDNGAKNVLFLDINEIKRIHTAGTWTGNTYVINGITLTINDDGTLTVYGTATSAFTFAFYVNDSGSTKYAGMELSGCPTGGTANTFYVYAMSGDSESQGTDYGDGAIIGNSPITRIRMRITKNTNMGTEQSPTIFKPMICSQADWIISQKYVPYYYPIKCVYARHISVACSTTLATTGLRFTAAEVGLYRVTVVALQTSAMPTGISIKQKVSASATQYTLTNKENNKPYTGISDVATLNVDVGGGFELFVSYETATNNQVSMIVEKIG